MLLFTDAANDNLGNMSEQVEVKTEPNQSEELFSVCKNTNMFANNSRQDEVTCESKNQS